MPSITRLFVLDGQVCCFLDMQTADAGSVHILTDEELQAKISAEREACASIADVVANQAAAIGQRDKANEGWAIRDAIRERYNLFK